MIDENPWFVGLVFGYVGIVFLVFVFLNRRR